MSSNISFKSFKDRVDQYALDCSDDLSNLSTFHYHESYGLSFSSGEENLFGKPVAQFRDLNDWAFQQLANRLNAPSVTWLKNDKLCDDELRIIIMNELIKDRTVEEDPRFLLRTKGENLRAILSDQYTKFDNTELVDLAGSAISEMGIEPEVFRAEVGDQLRTYLLFPQITFGKDPHGNDPGNGGLHPAIYLGNSEIGGGKAKAVGAVYRRTCDNGVIYGWNAEDIFAVRHRWISRAGMTEIMKNAMIVAFKLSEEAAQKFIASQDIHIQKTNMANIVNEWATKYGISIGAKEDWLTTITNEAQVHNRSNDPRAYDVVNAATYIAQRQDPNERESMERMAGDYLSVMVSLAQQADN
jgi:hypothetical protein